MTSRASDPGAGGTGGGREARHRDRRLVRFLHGELAPAERRELEAELGRDPALAARLGELERLWRSLEPPRDEAAPAGEGARLARAMLAGERRRRERSFGWLLGGGALDPAPVWGRPLVAGALAAGLAMGVWLGQPLARRLAPAPERPAVAAGEAAGGGLSGASGHAGDPERVALGGERGGERTGSAASDARRGEGLATPRGAESAGVREGGAPATAGEGRAEAAGGERIAAAPDRPADEVGGPAGGAFGGADATGLEAPLAGELTLAEAYLQALEWGDEADWEGSGP